MPAVSRRDALTNTCCPIWNVTWTRHALTLARGPGICSNTSGSSSTRSSCCAAAPARATLPVFRSGSTWCWAAKRADGSDATNLLSYMCLRAQADVGLHPAQSLHPRPPQQPAGVSQAAAFVISQGSGMPQVFNDEVIIPAQIEPWGDRRRCASTTRSWAASNCPRRARPWAGATPRCST